MKALEQGRGPINRSAGTENQSLSGSVTISRFLKEREGKCETGPVAREGRKPGNGEKSRSRSQAH